MRTEFINPEWEEMEAIADELEAADHTARIHSFNDSLGRKPLDFSDCKPLKVRWSKDRDEKKTTAIMTIIVLIVMAVVLCTVLKVSHDACVLEGSPDLCITN